jgi:hypothetical protein
MATRASAQYTVRGIPLEVDEALRRKAHRRRISLNRLLVEELAQAAGCAESRKVRSLKGLAGRWQDDPEFDRIVAEQRRVDRDLWR